MAKYQRLKRQYSIDGGNTWYDVTPYQYSKGQQIPDPQGDCDNIEWRIVEGEYICTENGGYVPPVKYRWVTAEGEVMCFNNSLYSVLKYQYSRDGGITWIDGGQTMTDELLEPNSSCCDGDTYICGQTIYRWVTVSGEYVCVGYDKYNKEKEQVSYDSGSTWTDTGNTRAGSILIEHNSEDCGYGVLTRWVADTGYMCVEYNKYNKEKEQQSTDGGTTWTDTGNTRAGSTLIETDSTDCGYGVSDLFGKDHLLTTDSSISASQISSTLGVNEDTNDIYLLSNRSRVYGNSRIYTSTTFTADFSGNLYYNHQVDESISGIYFVKNQKVATDSINRVKWRNIGESQWHTSNYFDEFNYNGGVYYTDLCLQYAFGKFLYILTDLDRNYYIGKVSMSFDNTPTVTCNQVVKINPPSGTTIYDIRLNNTYNLTTQTVGCLPELRQNGNRLYNYILTINTNSLSYNFIDTGDNEWKSEIRGTILYNSLKNYVYYNQHVYNITDNSLSGYINYAYGEYTSDISPLLLELYGKTYYWHSDNPEKYKYVIKT